MNRAVRVGPRSIAALVAAGTAAAARTIASASRVSSSPERWSKIVLRMSPVMRFSSPITVPIRSRDPAVPKGLAEVIHNALSRNAGQRFSTASQLRSALLPYSTTKAAK